MNESPRAIARLVLQAREALIMGLVARLAGDSELSNFWEYRYTETFAMLPPAVRVRFRRYIVIPAMNKVRREGVLAQNGRLVWWRF